VTGISDKMAPDVRDRAQKVLNLSEAAKAQFGGRYEIPSGNMRTIKGTRTPSLHDYSLASDLYPQDPKQLQSAAQWATQQPGVQTVIFNRQIWSPSKGWHPYSVKGDPHLTHVHVDYGRPASLGGRSQAHGEWTPPQPVKSKSKANIGLIERGNINLHNRPRVKNADGSISTVRSISIEDDGKEVLIPTVVGNKVVTDKQAIEHYRNTGEHLGKFRDVASANAYAKGLHESQAKEYGGLSPDQINRAIQGSGHKPLIADMQQEDFNEDPMRAMLLSKNPNVKQAAARIQEVQEAESIEHIPEQIRTLSTASNQALANGVATVVRHVPIPGMKALADRLHPENNPADSPLAKTFGLVNPESWLSMGVDATTSPKEFFGSLIGSVMKVINKTGSELGGFAGGGTTPVEEPSVDDYFTTAMAFGILKGGARIGKASVGKVVADVHNHIGGFVDEGIATGARAIDEPSVPGEVAPEPKGATHVGGGKFVTTTGDAKPAAPKSAKNSGKPQTPGTVLSQLDPSDPRLDPYSHLHDNELIRAAYIHNFGKEPEVHPWGDVTEDEAAKLQDHLQESQNPSEPPRSAISDDELAAVKRKVTAKAESDDPYHWVKKTKDGKWVPGPRPVKFVSMTGLDNTTIRSIIDYAEKSGDTDVAYARKSQIDSAKASGTELNPLRMTELMSNDVHTGEVGQDFYHAEKVVIPRTVAVDWLKNEIAKNTPVLKEAAQTLGWTEDEVKAAVDYYKPQGSEATPAGEGTDPVRTNEAAGGDTTGGSQGGPEADQTQDFHAQGPEALRETGKSSKRSGAVSVEALTVGVKPLVEQTIIPAAKDQYGKMTMLARHVQETFNPESVKTTVTEKIGATEVKQKVELAGRTARWIRSMTGHNAADAVAFHEAMRPLTKEFAKLSDKERLGFSDAVDRGVPQPNPKLEEIATFAKDTIKQITDARQAALREFDPKLADKHEANFMENYFPRVYDVSPEIAGTIDRSLKTGRRPLTGKKSFTKARTIADPEESRAQNLAAGRTLVTTNPFEMIELYAAQSRQFVSGMKLFSDLKTTPLMKGGNTNMLKFFRGRPEPGAVEGWSKINDAITTVFGAHTEEGAMTIRGEYWAPTDVARIVNNYLGPGFRGKSIFEAINSLSNTSKKVSFAISGFHSIVTSVNAMASDVALGLGQITGRNVSMLTRAKGAANIATFAKAPIVDFAKGTAAYNYLKRGISTDAMDFLESGGFKFRGDSVNETHFTGNMIEAYNKHNPLAAVGNALAVPIEQVANITMKLIVPRIKAGAALDLARLKLEQLEARGVPVGSDEYLKVAAESVDTIENRFGQVARDNMFMDNRVKDVAGIMTMFEWNMGSIREPLGALKDVATTRSRVHAGGDVLTSRQAGVLGVAVVTPILGGLYMYLHTGKMPEDMNDVLHPKTGRTIPEVRGKPTKNQPKGPLIAPEQDERADLPGYGRDYTSWKENWSRTLLGKRSPLLYNLGTAWDLVTNKDWKGDPIVMGQMGTKEKMKAWGSYLMHEVEPIAARQSGKAKDTTGMVEAAAGVRTKGREMSQAEQDRVQALHEMKRSKAIEQDQPGYKPPTKRPKAIHLVSANARPRHRWVDGKWVASA